MNVSNFTEKSKDVITFANDLATKNRNSEIVDFHMFRALLEDNDGLVCLLLKKMDIDVQSITAIVDDKINLIPKATGKPNIRFSTDVENVLTNAEKQAKDMNDEFISIEHIMLGLFDSASEEMKKFLKANKIEKRKFLNALRDIRSNPKAVSDKSSTQASSSLTKFGKDVTQMARENKLNPVIGRDEEIRNVIRILSRRTKNNPVLIGEPGVGKTAIVEGLAQRIVRGDVPTSLKGKAIFELDLGLLIAGAKYKGEFEERLTGILEEIDAAHGDIILFIDEIHNLVGAGQSSGSMDASNLLKPRLARGELHCLGATTLDEYREYIEKDPALVRRFQQVMVPEPTVEDCVTILRGIKEKFEIFHGVRILDSALIAAATMSNRYITDRFLPDKAIDLVDESCSMIRTEVESMPVELDEISRKIMQYEIEEKSLEREEDEKKRKRLLEIKEELTKLRTEFQDMKVKWETEKKNIEKIQKLKEKIDAIHGEIEEAERNYNLNKAAELKYKTLPNLQVLLTQEEKEFEKKQGKTSLIKNKVTEEEIAIVVSKLTGIPVSKLAEEEKERLLKLEDVLHERVVGQDEAVKKVSEAILRARAGVANPNRPIGSFLFLGPTGVGKTELGKTLAATLFDDEKNMIRIDMSEYMEKFSVTRLIGAPPGYVGYEEGGQLTEAVRRKPYSVVLFDEVEKAHPDVFNIFLQILDDGRVTDSQGRLIDFKNTVIILTSNLGSRVILESIQKNGEISDQAKDEISVILKDYFRPEFLNRLDEIIYFKALDKKVVYGIVKIFLESVKKRIKDKGIELGFTDNSIKWLIAEGYDIEFGARPLKRIVQDQVETMIAKKIISGELKEGDYAEVFYDKSIHLLNVRKRRRPVENSSKELSNSKAAKVLKNTSSTKRKKK